MSSADRPVYGQLYESLFLVELLKKNDRVQMHIQNTSITLLLPLSSSRIRKPLWRLLHQPKFPSDLRAHVGRLNCRPP